MLDGSYYQEGMPKIIGGDDNLLIPVWNTVTHCFAHTNSNCYVGS
jgi:hypothetical protein